MDPLDVGSLLLPVRRAPHHDVRRARGGEGRQVGLASSPTCRGANVGWTGERSASGIVQHPRSAGLLPVPRRRRPGDLRGQGHLAPQAPRQLLEPAAAPPHRGHDPVGRERRVDAGLGRGRRPDARVQPDPDPPAALQHPLPRRQVLPVPGAHRGGDLASGAGAPGCQAQEGALLRSLRARVGHPRHPRCAHPRVPGPHLFQRVLRSTGAREAAVPVLRHRPLRGAVRARGLRGHRGVLPRARRRHGRLPGGQSEDRCSAGSRPRWTRRPRVRSTNRPPSCATS